MKIKSKVVILSLIVFLVLAVGYIVVDKYIDARSDREIGIYNAGASYGYESAVVQIAQMASGCEVVPLILGNETLNVVAVDCLGKEP